ncbi:unnamed protein product [Musa acuminata subsp. burmannicoides]
MHAALATLASSLMNAHVTGSTSQDYLVGCKIDILLCYLSTIPHHPTRARWAHHFGPRWARFVRQKAQFDPKCSFSYDYLVLKETTTYNEIDLRVNKMMLGRRQADGCDGPEDRTTRQVRPSKREFSKDKIIEINLLVSYAMEK